VYDVEQPVRPGIDFCMEVSLYNLRLGFLKDFII
jgi:hypothetical protein